LLRGLNCSVWAVHNICFIGFKHHSFAFLHQVSSFSTKVPRFFALGFYGFIPGFTHFEFLPGALRHYIENHRAQPARAQSGGWLKRGFTPAQGGSAHKPAKGRCRFWRRCLAAGISIG
jgi:hypothetical protein